MIVCHCNSKSSSIWKTNLSTYINMMILKKNHLNYLTKVNRGIWIISCYCALSSTCYMVSFILNYWCAICNIRLEKYNNLISGNTIFITETTQLFLVLILCSCCRVFNDKLKHSVRAWRSRLPIIFILQVIPCSLVLGWLMCRRESNYKVIW